MAIAMIAAIPFAAAIALTDCFGIGSEPLVAEAPAPASVVVEAPVVAPAPVAQAPEPNIRDTCDITDFNARCAHSHAADSARTYAEAKAFADGNIVEVCFNSIYTSQYYSDTCKTLGRGY